MCSRHCRHPCGPGRRRRRGIGRGIGPYAAHLFTVDIPEEFLLRRRVRCLLHWARARMLARTLGRLGAMVQRLRRARLARRRLWAACRAVEFCRRLRQLAAMRTAATQCASWCSQSGTWVPAALPHGTVTTARGHAQAAVEDTQVYREVPWDSPLGRQISAYLDRQNAPLETQAAAAGCPPSRASGSASMPDRMDPLGAFLDTTTGDTDDFSYFL